MSEPTKEQIEIVFRKLKQNRYNKACFDCMSKNPSWASIPFGVYICTECSSAHRNLGVHISFVRSTVLDTWTWEQLRYMKVGGNQSALEFFSKHSDLATSKDTRLKYGGRAGQLYKAQLDKKVAQDTVENPNNVIIDNGMEPETSTSSSIETKNSDVVSTSAVEKPTEAVPVPVAVPKSEIMEQEPLTTSSQLPPTTGTHNINQPHITSNQIPTVSTRKLRSTMTTTRRNTKPNKFGVKKAAVNFDFEQAEANAKQESERRTKLGYNDNDDATEVVSSEDREARTMSSRLMYQQPSSDDKKTIQSEQNDTIEKLGFGMSRLNTSSLPSPRQQQQTTISYSSRSINENIHADDNSSCAKEKFGNARAISSDQYFGRNEYDPAVSAAESARLKQFSGASAISSSQYFGNNDSNDYSSTQQQQQQQQQRGGGGEWDVLQDQARRFVGQAAADLEAVRDLAENASSKVYT
ncbi:hypothetical protein BC941DRAFT_362423 [Chlamydoabsidia padenii]|nr:hypothetical protein BC941DRAFT_362423 [Chlamydoabsidia padenii]